MYALLETLSLETLETIPTATRLCDTCPGRNTSHPCPVNPDYCMDHGRTYPLNPLFLAFLTTT